MLVLNVTVLLYEWHFLYVFTFAFIQGYGCKGCFSWRWKFIGAANVRRKNPFRADWLQSGRRDTDSPVKHPLIQTTAEQSSSKNRFPAKNTALKIITCSFCLYPPLFFYLTCPQTVCLAKLCFFIFVLNFLLTLHDCVSSFISFFFAYFHVEDQ